MQRRDFSNIPPSFPRRALTRRFRGAGFQRATASPRRIKVGQIGTAHAHAQGKMETLRSSPRSMKWWAGRAGRSPPGAALFAALPIEMCRSHRGAVIPDPWVAIVRGGDGCPRLVPTARRCVAAGCTFIRQAGGESLEEFPAAPGRGDATQAGGSDGLHAVLYNPAIQFLFRALRDGICWDVFEVHGVISKQVDDGTRRELAQYRGGTMFELGCHLIDVLVKVLGPPDASAPTPAAHGRATTWPTISWPCLNTRGDRHDPQFGDRAARRGPAAVHLCGTEGVIDISRWSRRGCGWRSAGLARDTPAGYQDVDFPTGRP